MVQSLAALGLFSLSGLVARQASAETAVSRQAVGSNPLSLAPELAQGLSESQLVYLTPIQSSGRFSQCQAEIWFVTVKNEILVCTDSTSWRARAVVAGLQHTQIWVGDVGVWEAGFDAHLGLPELQAEARIAQEPHLIEAALDAFGEKYPIQWLLWGNRFRKGLTDGSRVMLAYRSRSLPS